MAVSTIPDSVRFVTETIHVGTAQYDGYYFADDSTHTAKDAISATVIGVTNNNSAIVSLFSWTTRVWTKQPNVDVYVRYLLQ
jgi:hypothetical protein